MRADAPATGAARTATRVLAIDAEAPGASAIAEAVAALRAGGVAAFPTETFYGLGAAVTSEAGVRRIFAVKGRSGRKPLLVLVDSVIMAETVAEIPAVARALAARHWPGSLTLVLPARPGVSDVVTAGTGTIGVRLSAHPVARALARALGEPITAPSANPSGAAPPRTAEEVRRHFDGAIDLVLDAGPTAGGLPSTVLDVTVVPPRVIRMGAVVP